MRFCKHAHQSPAHGGLAHRGLLLLTGLVVAVTLLMQAGPVQAGKDDPERRVALVIGNGTYQSVAPLPNPPNDAEAVVETLRGLGFEIIGGKAQTNLDRAGVERAIRNFGQALRGDAVGLFYYAGHGVQINGSNYLVPVSANLTSESDVKYELVDVNFVLDEMVHAGNRLNVVILDACRNNPFSGRGLRAVIPGLAQMQAPSGTVISYATQPGNVAADGDGKHSPFTEALTTSLRTPGRTVFDVFNDIGIAVKKKTGGFQQPWLATSPIEGQFYFAPPTADAGGTPPVTVASAATAAPVVVTAADKEALFWESIKDSQNAAFYQAYIDQFPNGVFTGLARAKLAVLQSRSAPVPATTTAAASAPVTAPPVLEPPVAAPVPVAMGSAGGPRQAFDIDTVPYLTAAQKAKLAPYVAAKPPKALAIGSGAHFAWASGARAEMTPEDVRRRALDRCETLNHAPCFLYSIDGELVEGVAATVAANPPVPRANDGKSATTTAAAPTGDARLQACVRFALDEYEGGEEPSPIRGQNKATAWCSCLFKEEPTAPADFKAFLTTRRGRAVEKTCDDYANWGE